MLKARSISGLIKELRALRMQAHNAGDEVKANKLYKLEQDAIFDNYLTPANIKQRFARI